MLSMDAGAFAPITMNYHQNSPNSLGVAGLGYASRGKASNIRRISVPTPQNISTASSDVDNGNVQTPRSSGRAQLLAGLRTAPKTPTSYSSQEQLGGNGFSGLNNSQFANQYRGNGSTLPQKTARGLGFAGMRGNNVQQQQQQQQQQTTQSYQPRSSPPQQQQPLANNPQQMYNSLPTLPSLSPQIGNNSNDIDNESKIYADLLAQNIYLAQQQQILQQQLRNVHQVQQLQQAQQQFHQLNVQSPVSSAFATPPMSPGFYMQNGNNNPQNSAYQTVYNPLTGQYNYYLVPPQQSYAQPAKHTTKQEERNISSEESQVSNSNSVLRRSPSPPKDGDLQKGPTPPPFRRGHKKSSSLSSCVNAASLNVVDSGPKTAALKTTPVPSTPMNSTFGGKGDHPVRQPRGPPSLEEITAKPTTKHEGSKNFATRQRRRAVFKLVHAGLERRRPRSMTPLSENEISLNFEDTDSVSSSQSGRHSSQSMHGDGDYSASSLSGDEGISAKVTDLRCSDLAESTMLRAPRPGLNAYEKRRSAMF